MARISRLQTVPFRFHGNSVFKIIIEHHKGLVSTSSAVFANICEVMEESPEFFVPLVGAAHMWVGNIVALRDVIQVRINVDWDTPLLCRMDLLVTNDFD